METVQRFKTAFIIISVLFILLGITLIIWPEFSLLTICKLCGVITLLLGLVRVIVYFRRDALKIYSGQTWPRDLFSTARRFYAVCSEGGSLCDSGYFSLVILIDSILRIQLSVELKGYTKRNGG